MPTNKKGLTEADFDEMYRLRKLGYTLADIADKFGVSKQYVSLRTRPEDYLKRKEAIKDQMRERYAEDEDHRDKRQRNNREAYHDDPKTNRALKVAGKRNTLRKNLECAWDEVPKIMAELWDKVEQQGFICSWCGESLRFPEGANRMTWWHPDEDKDESRSRFSARTDAPSLDHIKAKSKGGHPSDLINLQILHYACNSQKYNKEV